MYNNYINNGVIIKPNVLYEGDNATIKYNGLLFDSGADTVYMHAGYGCDWQDTRDIPMSKTSDGFEAKLPICHKDNINIAFKDCAENWDNNSGLNYCFEVQHKTSH